MGEEHRRVVRVTGLRPVSELIPPLLTLSPFLLSLPLVSRSLLSLPPIRLLSLLSLPKLLSSSSGWAVLPNPFLPFFFLSMADSSNPLLLIGQSPFFYFSFLSILTFHLNFPLIWAIQMAHQIFIITFIKGPNFKL